MKVLDDISDELLNAFIDNELDEEAENHILEAISKDNKLQKRYHALLQTKELVIKAYAEVPQPIASPQSSWSLLNRPLLTIAASVILMAGIFAGWLLEPLLTHERGSQITSISDLNVSHPKSDTILLHINTTDERRVKTMLQKAESLLANASQIKTPIQLEIVANADGLNILRKESPYKNEISSLSNRFNNVRFYACGIAKKVTELKEGKPIELLPEAENIPAALDKILNRLKDGWLYVQG